MAYQVQDYSRILGMQGISDQALHNHFKLYQGYVNNTNMMLERLNALLDEGKDRSIEYAEISRRFPFEFDGMRLHEYYFENLHGNGAPDADSMLYGQITRDFGSYDRWRKDFMATGAMRGIGWAIMYYDTPQRQLFNTWVEEHHNGILAGLQPLLVMDAWEHAYYLDYQTDRASYLNAFFDNINWQAVQKRFDENTEVQARKRAA